ncbi:hypothetical protein MASR2M15_26460 [Anaerolineales bacterium]
MELYSLPLAIEDFVPVIFSVLGFYFIARMITAMDTRYSKMAYLGVLLLAIGGFLKAGWKLIYALTDGQTDIRVFDNSLFFFLSAAFILLTFSLWYAQRSKFAGRSPANPWLAPLVLVGLSVGTGLLMGVSVLDPEKEGRQIWFFILLGVTTIFNFSVLILAIRQAMKQKEWLPVFLLLVNMIAIIMLQGMARAVTQTESIQWVEQITNSIAQGGLAFAAWRLYQHAKNPHAIWAAPADDPLLVQA